MRAILLESPERYILSGTPLV